MPLLSLLKHGFTPTLRDFNRFLLFLSNRQRFKCIIHLCTQMNSNLIMGNSKTGKILVNALLNDPQYEGVTFLQAHAGKSKIFHQNRIFDELIQGFCQYKDDPETGLIVLRDLIRHAGFIPSSFTFRSLIFCFSSQGKMDRVIEVLKVMSDERFKYPFDNFVCSAVISGFVRIRKPELAIRFYEDAMLTGNLKVNVVTCTAVLGAYYMLGEVDHVCDMVHNMEKNGLQLDVVFYTEWIYRYFKEEKAEMAFRKYKQMLDAKVEMDTVAYTVLVDGFTKEGNVEKSTGFVSNMIKDGLRPNIITYTALMLGFCKKGKLEEAFLLFEMVSYFGIEADEFVYAILIDGVCRKGDIDRAFVLVEGMEKRGIKTSLVAYNTIINGLCKSGRTSEGEALSKGIVGDVVTYSTLLAGYTEEGNCVGIMEVEKRFKTAGICMDIVMCNTLIKAYFVLGLFENALELYKKMPEYGLVADSITYCTMISGYFKVGRIDTALAIFDDYRQTSNSSPACYELTVCELCRNSMVDMASKVFEELASRNFPVSRMLSKTLLTATLKDKGAEGVLDLIYNMENMGGDIFVHLGNGAINMLSQRGSCYLIVDIFTVMIRNRCFIWSTSYYNLLKFLLFDGKMLLTSIILATFLKQYGMSEPCINRILVNYLCMKSPKSAVMFIKKLKEQSLGIHISVSLLEALARDGRALDAYELIVEAEYMLPDKDKINLSLIIAALCKERQIDKALRLCSFIRHKGRSLDIAVYNAVVNGLCLQGCLLEALRLFDSLEEIDLCPSEITYSTLVGALCREGHLFDARRLFDRMLSKNMKPNNWVYNSLIHGYCKYGQLEESLKLLLDLELHSLKPDGFTVSSIIYGYWKNGDMEGADKFFCAFKDKGILPDYLGFMYLVRGLRAKGRMEESRKILREMLQTKSVSDLLERIDCDNEIESIKNFLIFLCEKGRIPEAVGILDEVGSTYFMAERMHDKGICSRKISESWDKDVADSVKSKSVICSYESSFIPRCDDDANLKIATNGVNHLKKKFSESLEIDSYYEFAASLCSKGEINKANDVVKRLSGFL